MNFSDCPKCGSQPAGTMDTIPARANVFKTEDGDYEWTGDTDVIWDGQMTETDAEGRELLQCSKCYHEYHNEADKPILSGSTLLTREQKVKIICDQVESWDLKVLMEFAADGVERSLVNTHGEDLDAEFEAATGETVEEYIERVRE